MKSIFKIVLLLGAMLLSWLLNFKSSLLFSYATVIKIHFIFTVIFGVLSFILGYFVYTFYLRFPQMNDINFFTLFLSSQKWKSAFQALKMKLYFTVLWSYFISYYCGICGNNLKPFLLQKCFSIFFLNKRIFKLKKIIEFFYHKNM